MGAALTEFLSVKQLAEHLQVSEKTIYRMLWRGDLPGHRVGSQWRFSRSEVDYWLDLRLARLAPPVLREMSQGADTGLGPLAAALSPHNALILLAPGSWAEVVRSLIAAVEFPEPVDRKSLATRIWEREQMSSTSTAEGVAFLHTARWERRALVRTTLFAIGRLPAPIAFGSLDDAPADLLFLLLARDPRDQLSMLAGAAGLSRIPGFLAGIRSASSGAEVVDLVRRFETSLPVEQES
jgi:PTS system nitrogen regulatory IIA component